MNDKILKRLANLVSVKSIVTIVLTGVFFGTQSQKIQDTIENTGDPE